MNKSRNVLSQAILQQHRSRRVNSSIVKFCTKIEAMDRIHVLGAGNLGVFMAHSIRKSHPELPITLLVRRSAMLKSWVEFGRCVEILTNGKSELQYKFDVEAFDTTESNVPKREATISNLIVATKASSTKAAVEQVMNQLRTTSTLLFLQNGMGELKILMLCLFLQLTERKGPSKKLKRFSTPPKSHPFWPQSQIMAYTRIATFPQFMLELPT